MEALIRFFCILPFPCPWDAGVSPSNDQGFVFSRMCNYAAFLRWCLEYYFRSLHWVVYVSESQKSQLFYLVKYKEEQSIWGCDNIDWIFAFFSRQYLWFLLSPLLYLKIIWASLIILFCLKCYFVLTVTGISDFSEGHCMDYLPWPILYS